MADNLAVKRIEAILPRLVKDTLQRSGFQLQVYVEKFIDERGPTAYPSASPRWGSQSGRAARSFIPGQAENVTRFTNQGGRWSLEYGSRVPYVAYLESGTRKMIARPALKPGVDEFGRQQWPKNLEELMRGLAREFNR